MWYSRIHNSFRKILEKNSQILSKNRYIIMYGKFYDSFRHYSFPTNYIYCSACDSLVFIPENDYRANSYRDNHLKSCINEDTISKKYTRRKKKFSSINEKEFTIWLYKQYILEEKAKINRLRLELFFQFTSYSEKDKLASVSYDVDCHSTSYEIYAQSKATVTKNTISSASNYKSTCISPARQKIISPTFYQLSAPKGTTSEIFILS
jgi:hypothetical protein